MMKVVGEEGTSLDDYIIFLKGDFLDAVYFQQNSFDEVDGAVSPDRQKKVFSIVLNILASKFTFKEKGEARSWFNKLRQIFLDFNGADEKSDKFAALQKEIEKTVAAQSQGIDQSVAKLLGR